MAIFYLLQGDWERLQSRLLERCPRKRKMRTLRQQSIMSKIRLDKLRRLTLPPENIAQAGLRQKDVLDATCANGEIVLRPAPLFVLATGGLSMMDYAGTCQGGWGNTPAEVEYNVAQDRPSWDR